MDCQEKHTFSPPLEQPCWKLHSMQLLSSGILVLEASSEHTQPDSQPIISLGETFLSATHHYRDIHQPNHFYWEFITWQTHPGPNTITIGTASGNQTFPCLIPPAPPHAKLFNASKPMVRPDVYGAGPPLDWVHPEIAQLALHLQGKILDFGCGTGSLLAWLRQQNKEVFGLERDIPPIHAGLVAEAKPFVELTSGQKTLPFENKSWDALIASEVLEHLENPSEWLQEWVRITRDQLLITVPDITAIPRLAPLGIIPWHLLESTHLNFFNPSNLGKLLSPYADRVTFYPIGRQVTGGIPWHQGLAVQVKLKA